MLLGTPLSGLVGFLSRDSTDQSAGTLSSDLGYRLSLPRGII